MAPNGSKRAPFIVIEGLDRSGKTTQTALLQSRLESELGASTKLMKFPDRTTTIGQMIDSYLKSDSELDDHVIHLLFSANRWELASTIERLLNEGTVVLCDRYAFSGIAFSASKVVPERSGSGESVPKLPFEWCRAPDIGLPAPDLVLFLDIAPEQAKQRGGYGEERWRVIDAGRDVESVAADLWNAEESSTWNTRGFAEGLVMPPVIKHSPLEIIGNMLCNVNVFHKSSSADIRTLK
ncbi:thymidylate kinase [Coprinopsis cinerea okayama7|uniref:dTMP kinase n=1 Tax=Coprinopsis cinerea (strain Okayama-7 / 130 / ATCC MYA-4618 / FGSC 9003) TaxID=240176 RepID=A8NAG9_COPC7|nr:thymidylate kinase [Coprinopsis cinerea okayama7\|eukprot:XP_001831821.2 thymidylate kinase [Coprinopsis cinerea okayama7\